MNYTRANAVAVIGAGNSGQAVAGFLGLHGYEVRLWNREVAWEVSDWIDPVTQNGGLQVKGILEGFASVKTATTEMADAIIGADVIVVNTTMDGYQEVGESLAPHITATQTVILIGAGTLGTFDFWTGLTRGGFTDELLVGETSTTVFASRNVGPATVGIAGRKQNVEIATLPSGKGDVFNTQIPEFDFDTKGDVLRSGFNNIGPALHAVPMVLTAGWVEAQGGTYSYYADGITPSIAEVIGDLDEERLAVAREFGYAATPLSKYLTDTVGAPEGSLYHSIHNCKMYSTAMSETTLDHRYLWEETLAGVVPLLSLAELVEVPAPIHRSIANLAGALLRRNFLDEGRSLRSVGLAGHSVASIKDVAEDANAFKLWRQEAGTLASRVTDAAHA